jgi:hypothetical protein
MRRRALRRVLLALTAAALVAIAGGVTLPLPTSPAAG